MKILLDIDPKVMQQLVDMVKNASASLWKAALEQVQAQLYLDITWIIITLILIISTGTVGLKAFAQAFANANPHIREDDVKRVSREENETKGWTIGIGCTLIFVVGVIVFLVNVTDAFQLYFAPDYAAIKKLVDLIP